jgi:hypothetical protein
VSRGHRRIYVGASPGVGTTFAMLAEGHRRQQRGTRVVVGSVDTAGRPHTAELLDGLTVVPEAGREVDPRGHPAPQRRRRRAGRQAARLLRAAAEGEAPPLVVTQSFSLDFAVRRAQRADGGEVRLTPTEWHLVEALTCRRGRLVEQEDLLKEVWGPSYKRETNYLRVYIHQLRRKLEPDPATPRYFLTEPGLGYRFDG